MVKEYTMLSGQSLFDLAIQLYGDITQVFRLVADNPELDNIHSGFPGLVIQYEEQSTSLTEYYKNNTIDLTSGFPSFSVVAPPIVLPMIMVVDTTQAGSANDHFILPLNSLGTYDFLLDHDDGTVSHITAWDDPALDHSYSVGGVYNPSITGVCSHIFFNNTGDRRKLIDITQLGSIAFESLEGAFQGCSNLVGTWTDAPDLSGATSMLNAFDGCSVLTGSFNNWDVSTITNMQGTFSNCAVFDSPLNLWDTSSVTTMEAMFAFGGIFNQDISAWSVESCTTFAVMFSNQSLFNQSLDGWDPISCISIFGMFRDCTAFNSSLNGWGAGTINITQFAEAFKNCTAYNQSMDSWDTSSGLTAKDMFFLCTSFNQNLNTWDVSTFTNMQGMFIGASAFNGDITSWDTSSLTVSFNQDIGSWSTGNLAVMSNTFNSASAFNQDISSWDFTSATDMAGMFFASGFNSANYGLLLVSLDGQVLISGGALGGAAGYVSSDVDSGTTNGTTANKLVDTSGTPDFIANVTTDDIARNGTDTTYAVVDAIDSNSVLSVSVDIFVSGEDYTIESSAAAKARASILLSDSWTITDGGPV